MIADPGHLIGERLVPPDVTVRRIRSIAGRFGVTRLADVTGLDRIGIPVWMAIRPNSRSIAVNQGKGTTVAAAQASALMEAIELSVAERTDLPVRTATAAAMAAERVWCDRCPDLLRRGKPLAADDEPESWIQGHDLVSARPVWVPAAAATIDHTEADGRYWRSTDGLASGNTLAEAVLHGLCERIERDATALFHIGAEPKIARNCLDPAVTGNAELLAQIARIAQAGLVVRLFDITSDIGIPVMFATVSPPPDARMDNWRRFELVSGSGCHPDPARAAIRAVTEAVQSRLTKISGARDDFDPGVYDATLRAELFPFVRAEPGAEAAERYQQHAARRVGTIYQGYASGELEDDADVALLHGPAELDFLPLTVPMVEVAAILANLVAAGRCRPGEAEAIGRRLRAVFFKDRTWAHVAEVICHGLAAPSFSPIDLAPFRASIKAQEAWLVAEALAGLPSDRGPRPETWTFAETRLWRRILSGA